MAMTLTIESTVQVKVLLYNLLLLCQTVALKGSTNEFADLSSGSNVSLLLNPLSGINNLSIVVLRNLLVTYVRERERERERERGIFSLSSSASSSGEKEREAKSSKP